MIIPLTQSHRVYLAIREVKQSGRGIHRLVTLCGNIQNLADENDWRIFAAEGMDDENNEEVLRRPEDLQELAQR